MWAREAEITVRITALQTRRRRTTSIAYKEIVLQYLYELVSSCNGVTDTRSSAARRLCRWRVTGRGNSSAPPPAGRIVALHNTPCVCLVGVVFVRWGGGGWGGAKKEITNEIPDGGIFLKDT